jgi:hypothetical protein
MIAMGRQLAATVTLCAALGCVERTVTMTSEPSGALVHLNDREVGRTPVTVPFTHYGTYDVRLRKAGHRPLWTRRKASGPWWDQPGPDLFAGLDRAARVELAWHFELEKARWGEQDGEQALLQRAEETRRRLPEDRDPLGE